METKACGLSNLNNAQTSTGKIRETNQDARRRASEGDLEFDSKDKF